MSTVRYYRLPTDDARSAGARSADGDRLVARDGRKAYDLSSVADGLSSFRDLAAAATAAGVTVDELAERHRDDAALVDADTVESGAAVPARPDEVWAAGVTYEVSGDAREAESDRGELYQAVFESDRPELFFKATASRTVGPGEAVGVRGDSEWNVPEPELAVVLYRGEVVGYTVGNDVSSRSIEGANPLYLPQAKIYERCCALGPCVASSETVGDPHDLEIRMTIERDGETAFEGSTSTAKMARTCEELVSYLRRHNPLPEVAYLLTGTSLVPPEAFTLREGDEVCIAVENVGELANGVVEV